MSKYCLRSKKGSYVWIYDTETNRKKKIQLQFLIDRINSGSIFKKYFLIKTERDQFIEELKK